MNQVPSVSPDYCVEDNDINFEVEQIPQQWNYKHIGLGLGLLCGLLLISVIGLGVSGLSVSSRDQFREDVLTNLATRFPYLLQYCNIHLRACKPCPDQWTLRGSRCYYLSTKAMTWEKSRRYCIERGADLTVIESRDEQEFLTEEITELVKSSVIRNLDTFWIGLSDLYLEGEFVWVNNKRLNENISFWCGQNPNNVIASWDINQSGQDCAVMQGRKDCYGRTVTLNNWDDTTCRSPRSFICEGEAAIP